MTCTTCNLNKPHDNVYERRTARGISLTSRRWPGFDLQGSKTALTTGGRCSAQSRTPTSRLAII